MHLVKVARSPDVVWREEPRGREEAMRLMGAGEDPSQVGVVTLSAEDEISQLNYVGAEIWRLCDGTRTIDEVTASLGAIFSAEPTKLRADVAAFVDGLLARGWLVRADGAPRSGASTSGQEGE